MEWSRMKMNSSVIPHLQRGLESATSILYPYRCPICECIVDKRGSACTNCGQGLRYIVSPFCMICGKPVDYDDQELCMDCSRRRHEFTRGVAAFAYTEEIKKAMYRFKYNNRREYAAFFAGTILDLKGHIIRSWDAQALVPVPLHFARQRARGYNQAELIARELGRGLNLPVVTDLIERTINTTPQKKLDDKDRVKNTKSAFQTRKNSVQYKQIVLIDDIYTTGATLDACASVLKGVGCEHVYHACVCVGRGF